jgi:DNA polymerase III delta subunit
MLRVFYGSDQIKVRQQAYFFIDANFGEGREVIRLEADNYQPGQLRNLAETISLFSEEDIYLIDSPSGDSNFFAEVMSELSSLSSSVHQFILLEKELLAADKKNLAKFASGIEEYKKEGTAFFSPFKLSDALAVKDKKNLWLLLQEAKQNQIANEELIGILWWQLKSIRLAAATNNATEAGMKDYPYKKAKASLRSFRLEEVERKSRELLKLYHESRRGKRDLDLALEEWVLSI